MRIGWILRVPSLIYFQWIYESFLNNSTSPETYFVQMMQSMFIVPETDRNVFPSLNFILQFFIKIIAYVSFLSVAIFNINVVKKLYVYLIAIIFFVMGCNQYRLILTKLCDVDNGIQNQESNSRFVLSHNHSQVGSWNIYWVDFIQFIPLSQFKSASLIIILPLIFCPWLIFVQYFHVMSNQVLALSYGIANLPGLCLALNLPVEAQFFTYNFSVTSFLIAIIYKIICICMVLPRTLSDFLADVFVVINFNHHAAAWIEMPSVLWSLFDLSRQFFVFWVGLLFVHMLQLVPAFGEKPLIMFLASVSESVQSPLGLIGFSVASCYTSRYVLRLVNWLLDSEGLSEINNSNGIAEGFSTLLMMISLNRSVLKVKDISSQSSVKVLDSVEKNGSTSIGLIALVMLIIFSSILEAASELINSKLLYLTAVGTSQKFQKHIVPLILSAIIFVVPIIICCNIYELFTFDFWLITIMGSFLMTSVHILNSCITYGLYMNNIQMVSTGSPYIKLKCDVEEIIMWSNIVVQILELCVAAGLVLLLIMRALQGHWNVVSLMLLIVHFYFNIFERIKNGWNHFNHRKSVKKKIDKMYTVSDKEEIAKLEDVCAICFNEFSAGDQNGPIKRTICMHFFHKECLKKWLFIKHSCPMCSRSFHENDKDPNRTCSNNSDRTVESDTESLSLDEEYDLVSSTSESSVYDDKDIDLKVYQNPEDEDDNSSSVHSSSSITPIDYEVQYEASENEEEDSVIKRSITVNPEMMMTTTATTNI